MSAPVVYYPGEFPKICTFVVHGKCDRTYSEEKWAALELLGYQPMEADALDPRPEAHRVELRNCAGCATTLAVAVKP